MNSDIQRGAWSEAAGHSAPKKKTEPVEVVRASDQDPPGRFPLEAFPGHSQP